MKRVRASRCAQRRCRSAFAASFRSASARSQSARSTSSMIAVPSHADRYFGTWPVPPHITQGSQSNSASRYFPGSFARRGRTTPTPRHIRHLSVSVMVRGAIGLTFRNAPPSALRGVVCVRMLASPLQDPIWARRPSSVYPQGCRPTADYATALFALRQLPAPLFGHGSRRHAAHSTMRSGITFASSGGGRVASSSRSNSA